MKKFYYFLFIFSISINLSAQTAYVQKFYTPDILYDGAKSMIAAEDGGFLYYGIDRDNNSNPNVPVIMKVDSMGNPIWRKRYPNSENFKSFSSLYKMNDGSYLGLFVKPVYNSSFNDTTYFSFIKFDKNWNAVSLKSFYYLWYDNNIPILKNPVTGNIMVAVHQYGNFKDSKGIFEFDATLNPIRSINASFRKSSYFYGFELDTEGGFYISGTEQFDSDYNAFVGHIGVDGSIIWSHADRLNNGIPTSGGSIVALNGGDILWSFSYVDYVTKIFNTYISRINKKGEFVWQKQINPEAGDTIYQGKVFRANDGQIYFQCSKINYKGQIIVPMDEDGKFSQGKVIIADNSPIITAIKNGKNGSLTMLGSEGVLPLRSLLIKTNWQNYNCFGSAYLPTTSETTFAFADYIYRDSLHLYPYHTITVNTVSETVKVDSIECLPDAINEISNKSESFEILPNPNDGNFTVKMNSSANDNAIIRIYNLSGKLEASYSKRIIRGENSIPVNATSLVRGLYILEIKTDSGSIFKKLIVQ